MSLTARNAQVYKGTAAVTYGSGSGVSNRELQGTATITYGGAPTSNTALSLPGTSGNVMNLGTFFPSRADPSTSNIFVEAWIYLPTGATGFPFTVSDSSSEDMGLLVNYSSTVQFRVWNTAGSGINSTNNGALASATWYHVAGSFDRTNNRVYGFVNGVVGTGVGVFSGTARARSSSNMTIGAGNSGTFFPFNGYIQDFRMVQGGIVPTTSFTPVGVPFRGSVPQYMTGGSTVLNLYDQYFNPSLLNLPGTSGNYMNLGSTHPAHINSTTNNIFVECWVYAISFPNGLGFIFAVTGGSISTEEYSLWMSSTYGINWHVRNTLDGAAQVQAGTITTNRWYHIAGSWNYSNQTIYGFVNGSLVGSATLSGTPRYNTSSSVQIGAANSAGFLGDYYPFNGYIQDLRVTRGGTVPTTSFTPAAAPFGLASPSYVTSGTTVLSLATQYYQTGLTAKTLFSQISSAASASAKGIYSLYAINGASPLVINVRNGTTAATSDFYGDIFGNLTTSAGQSISSWLGAATGFITTWYDQSGLGNHAAQATTALQPSITLGTPNLINFGGTGYFTIANQVMPIGNGVFTTVTKLGTHPTASQIFIWNFGTTGSQGCVGFDLRTDYSPNRYEEFFYGVGDVTGPTYTPNATVSGVYNQSSHTLHLNGAQIGTSAVSSRNGIAGNQTIGAIIWAPADGRGTTLYTGTMRDLYVFSTALSTADRNIMENGYTGTKVQFTSRPILTPVLVNPGPQRFTIGGSFTVAQTALQPVNGITWSISPLGAGVNITNSTDYSVTLTTPSIVPQSSFNITASNKLNQIAVAQIVGATPLLNQVSSEALASAVGIYSLRAVNDVFTRVAQVRGGTAYPPTMAGSTSQGYTASASSTSQAAYLPGSVNANPWQAFDNSATTFWENFYGAAYGYSTTGAYVGTVSSGGAFYTTAGIYNGEWLQIQFPMATFLQSYSLQGRSGQESSKSPNTFVILGSNDGTNWTLLDSRSGVAAASYASQAVVYFTISNRPTAYTYFRMVVQNVQNTGAIQTVNIAAWTLNPLLDFYADTLGNLTTETGGAGETLASWLGGATGYVATWYDQSSLRNHATQTVAINQPIINANTRLLVFNGSSTYFDLPNGTVPSGNSNYTMIVRHGTLSPGAASCFVGSGTFGTNNATNALEYNGPLNTYYNFWWNNDNTGGTYVAGNVVTAKYNNTVGRTLYVNGTSVGTNNSLTRASTTIQNTIGTDLRAVGRHYLNGELYFVNIFSTPLSDSDRIIVELDGRTSSALNPFSSLYTAPGAYTASGDGNVRILVVAGGGQGGPGANRAGGGGGGGGVVLCTSFPVTLGTSYAITVGAGGSGQPGGAGQGADGLPTTFVGPSGTITAIGGGGGEGAYSPGRPGGSGGGGGQDTRAGGGTPNPAGTGTQPAQPQPPNCINYGNPGNIGAYNGVFGGAGGGGASGVGGATSGNPGGVGGSGVLSNLSGGPVYYGAGGGGATQPGGTGGAGGTGGGGPGASNAGNGANATGFGGGGGAGASSGVGGSGYQGCVIISYP